MSKNTFSSFKELLVKKDLSGDDSAKSVDYKVLVKIFAHLSKEVILSSGKHFDEEDQTSLKQLLKKIQSQSELSQNDLEALIKEELKGWDAAKLVKFSELLEPEAADAQAQAKRIEKLAKKYQPKDANEEYAELQNRIKELQMDIVDIEMNLMQMEQQDQQNSERYKKANNARERRKQVVQRLEKQIQGIEKKLAKQQSK